MTVVGMIPADTASRSERPSSSAKEEDEQPEREETTWRMRNLLGPEIIL